MSLLLHSTSTALWHSIIHDAEESCSISLKEEVEAYLVFLLMRYMDKPDLSKRVMALDFLRGMQRQLSLQEAGDVCLLFAGLYPKTAEKRLVRISYFVKLGQASYSTISQETDDLYDLLSYQFVSLMDILQSIRVAPDLLPLEAYELWNDTGSQRALKILRHYTKGNLMLLR